MSCEPSPTCTVRSSKTILAHLRWQGFLSFALGPSTLTCATIIFANMCTRDSSRSSMWTSRTKLLMPLPNPWHKTTFNVILASCAASDFTSNQSEGVLHMWYFGTYFYRTFPCTVSKINHACLLEQNVLFQLHRTCYFKHEIAIFRSD
jgi:hypothetical protein